MEGARTADPVPGVESRDLNPKPFGLVPRGREAPRLHGLSSEAFLLLP